MPVRVPDKPRAKAISKDDARRTDFGRRGGDSHEPVDTIDWLAWWTLSLAVSAVFIAGLAFFQEGDVKGAAAVLGGTAIIMALALGITKAPGDSN